MLDTDHRVCWWLTLAVWRLRVISSPMYLMSGYVAHAFIWWVYAYIILPYRRLQMKNWMKHFMITSRWLWADSRFCWPARNRIGQTPGPLPPPRLSTSWSQPPWTWSWGKVYYQMIHACQSKTISIPQSILFMYTWDNVRAILHY